AQPGCVLHRGQFRAPPRHQRPVFLPLRPLLNPDFQRLDLSVCELPPGIDRWHTESFILCADTAVKLAARRVAGYNRAAAVAEIRPCGLFEIKSELRLAVRFVRAVTGKAGVGQDGTDVSIELHLSIDPVAGTGQAAGAAG